MVEVKEKETWEIVSDIEYDYSVRNRKSNVINT